MVPFLAEMRGLYPRPAPVIDGAIAWTGRAVAMPVSIVVSGALRFFFFIFHQPLDLGDTIALRNLPVSSGNATTSCTVQPEHDQLDKLYIVSLQMIRRVRKENEARLPG